jgi:Anti-sigma-K factor rskA, C-terminal
MTDRSTNAERERLILDAAGGAHAADRSELSLLVEALGSPSTWAEPGPGLEDAVVRAVTTAQRIETSSRRRTQGPRPHVGRRRWRLVVSASVAAAVIAAIVGIGLTTGSDERPDYRAELVGTGMAASAHAAADITRTDGGFSISLDAHGLPTLRSGEYYQAWLKNAGGTLVPIGTFSSSKGQVTLWSGVSPKNFPTMTVTIENADDAQASSGRRVLVGAVRTP